MSAFDYDFFVIGAGSGGVRASRIAASLGARVGVAEERYFGGTCVNVGCVPKKLFSYAAHFADDFEDSRGFGWEPGEARFDWPSLIKNKDTEIKRLNGIYKSILDKAGVTVHECRARLLDGHSVDLGDRTVTAETILLAVGGWPWVPDIPGQEHVITSNEVFHLDHLPESIMIQGGGYIAVEFASIFSRLGCETTLIYRGDRLLRGFDADIRQFITAQFQHDVNLILNDDIKEISKHDNGLGVLLDSGNEVTVSTVMAATGRTPLTADLGLENVGVELADNGAVRVDNSFRTREPSIYAVGDVIDRMALTPVALAEGEFVARSLFSKDKHRGMDYNNVATAVFCHPNIATVGLTEEQALEAGYSLAIYESTSKPLKHTLSGRDERALIKLVVDQKTDRVLGVHIIAQDAGELVQGFAVALNCGATKADFDRTIGIHPTLAEEVVTMRSKRETAA